MTSSTSTAPHPGSQKMPQWDLGELPDTPVFSGRNWFAMIGPGLMMAGAAIGGGEWLTGPLVTARYGGGLLWLATLSILAQVVYNMEICRYTLYSGEPIFTGKFRTLPGPAVWLWVYVLLDFGSVFPYLASSAATPLGTVILGYVPNTDSAKTLTWMGMTFTDVALLKFLGYMIFLGALVPLIFGGKVYNSLKAVMTFKIVMVLGFLMLLAIFFSKPATWIEIGGGFFKFGNVPVLRGEDADGDGKLSPGEDWDSDGHLDVVEKLPPDVDTNKDGKPDAWSDRNGDGKPDKFNDVDGDGIQDGDNIDNVFVSLFTGRGFPIVNLSMIGLLCAMVAISGQGGLSNTPISNYTRDQGWGMGSHVGAIPSVVGGHNLTLSHVGMVFEVNEQSLVRWKKWYQHVLRDQVLVWMPACFVGLALPSMLSVQFLRRGVEADPWTAAGMTAGAVGEHVGAAWGTTWGPIFSMLTLFCGFLVLAPSMASTADGVIRRWVDVFWTSSATLRELDTGFIRKLYFRVLIGYAIFGLFILIFVPPGNLLLISTTIYNFALGFSCWHTLYLNLVLLPPALRPGWFVRITLALSGVFFLVIATVTVMDKLKMFGP